MLNLGISVGNISLNFKNAVTFMFASLLSQDLKISTVVQEPHMLQSKVIRMSSLSVNIQENTIQNHKLSNSNI